MVPDSSPRYRGEVRGKKKLKHNFKIRTHTSAATISALAVVTQNLDL